MPHDPDRQFFAAGEWKRGNGVPVINPGEENIIGAVPHATRMEIFYVQTRRHTAA